MNKKQQKLRNEFEYKESKIGLLRNGFIIIDQDEHQYVLAKRERVIPGPLLVLLALAFLPLILLVFWKKDVVKIVPKHELIVPEDVVE